MSCNYCWNQPKKYERYDLYLDGKIKADDFVYRTKDAESGEIIATTLSEKIDEIEDRLATHFTFNTDYATITDLESAFNNGELKETVIYIVKNETVSDNPDSRDSYNEYMVVTVKDEEGNETKTLELIGSGSYAKHEIDVKVETDRATARENEIQSVYDSITGYSFEKLAEGSKQNIDNRINQEIEDRIADVSAEEDRATEKENALDQKIDDTKTALEEKIYAEEKRAIEVENELSVRIKTIEDYDIDSRVKQLEIDLPAETSRAQKEENNLLNKFADYTTTTDLEQNYSTKSDLNDVDKKFADYTTTVELEENYATKSSLNDYTTTTVLEENYSTKAELNAVDKKFEDYDVTIQSLQEQIAALEKRIAALEPENGEVTESTDPETPTE